LLGGPSMEPRNLILFRLLKPRKFQCAERGGDSCKQRCQNGSDDTQRSSSGGAGEKHSSRAGQSQLRKVLPRAHLQRVVGWPVDGTTQPDSVPLTETTQVSMGRA